MKKLTAHILAVAVIALCFIPMASADDGRKSMYKEIIDYALTSDGAYSEWAAYQLTLAFDDDAMGLVDAMAEYSDGEISTAASLLVYGKSYYDLDDFEAAVKSLQETADSKQKAVLETIVEAINGYRERNFTAPNEDAVKNCIDNYFALFYTALFDKTFPDLDAVFESNVEMEFFRQAIRNYIRGQILFDTKYAGYSYEIDFQSIEVMESTANVTLKLTERTDYLGGKYGIGILNYTFMLRRSEGVWKIYAFDTDDIMPRYFIRELRERVGENATVEDVRREGIKLSAEWNKDPNDLTEEELRVIRGGALSKEEAKTERRRRHFELLSRLPIVKDGQEEKWEPIALLG